MPAVPGGALEGLIPAYAGSTLTFGVSSWGRGAHPRLRGEHMISPERAARGRGSSPLTRGAPQCCHLAETTIGLIPAYAGSTGFPTPDCDRARAHPRLRGEHLNFPLC